jgi:uncharacterized protein (TIGR02145 family)
MRARAIFVSLFAIMGMVATTQRPTMELTFTAGNNGIHVQMDSIKVMNRTQGSDTVLYWPDTMLSIYFVGIPRISNEENTFQVFQNYPNPVTDQTNIMLYIPEKDKVSIIVTDILGRLIIQTERVLNRGKHTFRFTPGSGSLYFFTALWKGNTSSIKILQAGFHSGETSSLEYAGSEDASPQLKNMKDIQDFSFNTGDELLYIGYADTLQSGMLDAPEESAICTFQFATNIPCPGTPTVEYEGQVYSTIQIFSQCWLKENLNLGLMIEGTMDQTNNGTIEKYCYNNEPDSCTKYGGLYQWDEMMQYTAQQGVRGICPPGWHLPTDEEWKLLEGAVDSQYGIGDNIWDGYEYRGLDAGANLKTTGGWYENGNGTDLFGFSGLPAGDGGYGDSFHGIGDYGKWWTSTERDLSGVDWGRGVGSGRQEVVRYGYGGAGGLSVRCLQDEANPFPSMDDGTFDDWAEIPYAFESVDNSGGLIEKVKLAYDGIFIYFYMEVRDYITDSLPTGLHFDLDNEITTGFIPWTHSGIGSDFYIEGGIATGSWANAFMFDKDAPSQTDWEWIEKEITDYIIFGFHEQVGDIVKTEWAVRRDKLEAITTNGQVVMGDTVTIMFNQYFEWEPAGFFPGLGEPAYILDMTSPFCKKKSQNAN